MLAGSSDGRTISSNPASAAACARLDEMKTPPVSRLPTQDAGASRLCFNFDFHILTFQIWQGRRDSNPRLTVLETDVVAARPRPYIFPLKQQNPPCLAGRFTSFWESLLNLLAPQRRTDLRRSNGYSAGRLRPDAFGGLSNWRFCKSCSSLSTTIP